MLISRRLGPPYGSLPSPFSSLPSAGLTATKLVGLASSAHPTALPSPFSPLHGTHPLEVLSGTGVGQSDQETRFLADRTHWQQTIYGDAARCWRDQRSGNVYRMCPDTQDATPNFVKVYVVSSVFGARTPPTRESHPLIARSQPLAACVSISKARERSDTRPSLPASTLASPAAARRIALLPRTSWIRENGRKIFLITAIIHNY